MQSSVMRQAYYPYFVIAFAFCISRLVFFWAGVSFHYQLELDSYVQYLDAPLLKTQLLTSLLYLHSQPPLFNALLGISLKLFGAAYYHCMHAMFMLLGLALNMMLFRLLQLFAVPTRLALATTLIYLVSPSQILYENYLFYAYPTAVLLTLSAWCVLEMAMQRSTRWAYATAWGIAALCLLRSNYHIAIFAIVFVALYKSFGARTSLKIISLPFLLVLAWYVKNLAMFGFFGGSSWLGMNVAQISVATLPPAQKDELFARTQDPLVYKAPFAVPDALRPLVHWPTPVGPPAFSESYKSTGWPNYNYGGYLAVSKRYMALSKQALQVFPENYLRNVGLTFCWSMAPTENNQMFPDNLRAIAGYANWYDLFIWLTPSVFFPFQEPGKPFQMVIGLTPLFIFPVSLMAWWHRQLQNRRVWTSTDRARAQAMLFMMLMIAYVFCISNFLVIGESNRYRFDWEPLMVVVMVAAFGGNKMNKFNG